MMKAFIFMALTFIHLLEVIDGITTSGLRYVTFERDSKDQTLMFDSEGFLNEKLPNKPRRKRSIRPFKSLRKQRSLADHDYLFSTYTELYKNYDFDTYLDVLPESEVQMNVIPGRDHAEVSVISGEDGQEILIEPPVSGHVEIKDNYKFPVGHPVPEKQNLPDSVSDAELNYNVISQPQRTYIHSYDSNGNGPYDDVDYVDINILSGPELPTSEVHFNDLESVGLPESINLEPVHPVQNISNLDLSEGSGEPLLQESIIDEKAAAPRTSRFINLFSDTNETDPACMTPKNESGHCRHFKNCVLHEVLNNFNMYLQYMCVRTSSVGLCCPDDPVIEVVNPDYNSTKPNDEIMVEQPIDGCGMNSKTRIVGGMVSKPHEWTWMVALFRNGRFFCGGVLLNNWYVLTAAHCTLGVDIRHMTVRLGEYNLGTKMEHQQDIGVSEIRRHGKFTTLTFQHDIALLKLRRPVEYSRSAQTICLPQEGRNFTGVDATVVGWGTVSFGGAISPILRQVTIPVWENSQCDRAYILEKIDNSFLCAGSLEDEKDACQGDSGGPLMSLNDEGRWTVIGIVSFGRRCGDPNFPGVYTRVTTYLQWIKENIR